MAYSLQTSPSEPQDDVTVVRTLLRSISWNYRCTLVISSRQVVSAKVLIAISMKSNSHSVMLLCGLLPHDLECLFIELHVRMGLVEDSLNDCHYGRTQIVIVSFPESQLLLWIIDIDLGKNRSLVGKRKDGACKMMKFPTDSK